MASHDFERLLLPHLRNLGSVSSACSSRFDARPSRLPQTAKEDFHALRQMIDLAVLSKLLPVSKIGFRL